MIKSIALINRDKKNIIAIQKQSLENIKDINDLYPKSRLQS